MLKVYYVGVCVCLTSSGLDAEGVLYRCVGVSDLFDTDAEGVLPLALSGVLIISF